MGTTNVSYILYDSESQRMRVEETQASFPGLRKIDPLIVRTSIRAETSTMAT